MDLVSPSEAVIFGGQGKNQDLAKQATWKLMLTDSAAVDAQWINLASPVCAGGSNAAPSTRTGHASAFDRDNSKLHVFGGAKNKRFFSDIHVLDIASAQWTAVKPVAGTAPTCSYHSANAHRGELFVFGGVYPEPDPIPDTCSNTLHIFNFAEKNWYRPSVSGELPSPRSGHSSTLVEDSLIIFGGWDMPAVFSDCFALDLTMLEFARLSLAGTAPSCRSWHAATKLPFTDRRCLLVHGGYDGDNALNDAFVLDLDRERWIDVSDQFVVSARAGHAAVATTCADGSVRVSLFGGGDNDGGFFNDVSAVVLTDAIFAA